MKKSYKIKLLSLAIIFNSVGRKPVATIPVPMPKKVYYVIGKIYKGKGINL